MNGTRHNSSAVGTSCPIVQNSKSTCQLGAAVYNWRRGASVGSLYLQGGSTMSRTLKLVDRLMAMGRNYLARGRDQEALQVFGKVAGFRKLPRETAEEAQVQLAEIYLRRKNYRRARRHL